VSAPAILPAGVALGRAEGQLFPVRDDLDAIERHAESRQILFRSARAPTAQGEVVRTGAAFVAVPFDQAGRSLSASTRAPTTPPEVTASNSTLRVAFRVLGEKNRLVSSLGYLAAVNLVIWAGLFFYLWRLDRRISEKEREP